MSANINALAEKIESLSQDQIAEVEDFVDFLRLRGQHRALTQSSAAMSSPTFEAVWNNPGDAAYDAL